MLSESLKLFTRFHLTNQTSVFPPLISTLAPSVRCLDWSQNYDGEIVDDYITGVEQVGVDPTAAVETVAPVDTKEKVDPATDMYEFKEYDLKEYDNKEFGEKTYDYGDYDSYGTIDAKPTSVTYEEEFGPGVPAETDFRESSVSDGTGQGVGGVNGQECEKMEKMLVA